LKEVYTMMHGQKNIKLGTFSWWRVPAVWMYEIHC